MSFNMWSLAVVAASVLATTCRAAPQVRGEVSLEKRWYPITPKVVIFSMFENENVWVGPLQLDQNIILPGLSPLFPEVQCDAQGDVCHITTGEAEINAACSVMALLLSDKFDFTKTYFLIAGIAGVNPFEGTLGAVGLARFAVQVALANEIDARQKPSNWTTGYWLQNTDAPGDPPSAIYGTEVFELNTNLRDKVHEYIKDVKLNDTEAAAKWRSQYNYAPASQPPAIFYGDVATSDNYFDGSLLAEAFGNITKQWTNNTGVYAFTAQEDNASFEAMIRAQKAGLIDFSRVILMRTASDFDRSAPGVDEVYAFETDQGGFEPAIVNIFVAGQPLVQGILDNWSDFENGVAPQDGWAYDADDLHTLAQRKRSMSRRRLGRALPRA